MAVRAMLRQAAQLRQEVRALAAAQAAEHPSLTRLRQDPAHAMRAAGLALRVALLERRALVLMLSPSEKQSVELLRKALDFYHALGRPVPAATPRDSSLRLELANGSRLLALPGNETTVRCYSAVRLLVVDEAARVPDPLYFALRPMLSVSGGQLVALTTPAGKRGWLWEAWKGAESWHRVKATADRCPRISPEFLAEERRVLGPRWAAQEYDCSFEDLIGALYSGHDIEAMLCPGVEPLEMPS
jgi:hypothetical protein